MAKESNIVHRYFKKKFDNATVFVKVNPILFKGLEITRSTRGELEVREVDFDADILEDLAADRFEESSPLEFNLYYSGLAK
jgi:hypothetical protein